MLPRFLGRKPKPPKLPPGVTIVDDQQNPNTSRIRSFSIPHKPPSLDLPTAIPDSPLGPLPPNPDPIPPVPEPKKPPGMIPITSASVLPIKKSIAQKFNVNVSSTLPLLMQSTLNIAAADLARNSQQATEKLEEALTLTHEANESAVELERFSEGILTASTATLTEMRGIRSEIENVRKIPRPFTGKILLLIVAIVGLILGILRAVKNGILKVFGLIPSNQDEIKIPKEESGKS
jgi:uncharacterized protein YlxP (DUF503 family)